MKRRSGRRSCAPADYRERTYRQRVGCAGLVSFRVVCQETDLLVQADRLLESETREHVLGCRGHIEGYINCFPDFATTLVMWAEQPAAPKIITNMIAAGRAAGVGPMAAVAGAVAECVGRELLKHSRQVVVENGGDIFLKTERPVVAGLFAGNSPLNMKIGLRLPGTNDGIGLCTSSGTVGHSLSTGTADAVCVVSRSCALADAAATAIGNRIRTSRDIQPAIAFAKRIAGVRGVVVIADGQLAAWGQVELVPLKGKKG
ncbi:UPF0280 family protein [Desulfosarcina sp.]|uniref:UPF0280 family protein n=1 Tax=Desulfosarcina sp. TaxID=2027861 RepID=UPI003970A28C